MATATPSPTLTWSPLIVTVYAWDLTDRVNYAGAVLYAILSLAILLGYCLYQDVRHKWFKLGVHNCFYLFAYLVCIFRVTWLLYRLLNSNGYTAFFINRLCSLFFFSAFSVIVVFWATNYNKQFDRSKAKRVSNILKILFLVLNIVMYIVMIVLSIVFIKTSDESESWNGIALYEASIAIMEALDAVVAIGFLIYGFLFVRATLKILRDPAMRIRFAAKILFITISYAALMSLRVAMLLYRPITGKYFNYIVFQCFAYYIPEILPIMLQLFTAYLMRGRSTRKATAVLPPPPQQQQQKPQQAELHQSLLVNDSQK